MCNFVGPENCKNDLRIFFCTWITRKWGGGGVTSSAMWEVHLHEEKTFCDIENFVARAETGDGALESY